MIKLIITDIDGTLVDDHKNIPEELHLATEQILNKNIIFCAASGRQSQSLQEIFKPFHTQMGLLSENGALVNYKGEIIYSNPMKKEDIQLLLDKAKVLPNISITICGKESAYLISKDPKAIAHVELHYPVVKKIENLDTVDDELYKLSIYDERGSRNHSYPHFKDIEDTIKVAISGDQWLDFTNKSVNKGVAITHLQKELGILPSETLVFGDYLNDLEMMQCAHHSYAMKNAQPEVKKVANFVTKHDNNNKGVLRTLEELGIITL